MSEFRRNSLKIQQFTERQGIRANFPLWRAFYFCANLAGVIQSGFDFVLLGQVFLQFTPFNFR